MQGSKRGQRQQKTSNERAIRIEDSHQSNFIPVLEGYCRRGDAKGLTEFIKREKAVTPKILENKRALIYLAIEAKQAQILKVLLTSLPPYQENYNLLHIACRP